LRDLAHPHDRGRRRLHPAEERGEVQREREVAERDHVVRLVHEQLLEQWDSMGKVVTMPGAVDPMMLPVTSS
jgi:hypothetical protein